MKEWVKSILRTEEEEEDCRVFESFQELGIEEDCDRKFGWKKLKKKCRSSFCTRILRKWVLQKKKKKKICENWVQARKNNRKMHRNSFQAFGLEEDL